MKVLLFFLAVIISMQASAAGNTAGLAELIDNYRYAVEVEWDQRDQIFMEEQREKFLTEAAAVLKNEEYSKEEVLSLIKAKVKNQVQAEALITRLKQAASANEITSIIAEQSSQLYSHGASWFGVMDDDTVYMVVILVLTVEAGIALGLYERHKTEEYLEEHGY